ncbi:ABC transporter substrate-binding protein [Clostridium sp. AM58-1XD]|uniref:ABC transporter substrate-binding protein n=1 Tax=Clostridium sp. AM58-1XD TaxID=2292307 RepID=UPI000E502103|nr:ABC transporter substrate-binding protein [Clostridium sp. AM58-1XD]RGZ00676.1 ABC transporter substrate-binding protein [Clostridium sp. AM58-1XD]
MRKSRKLAALVLAGLMAASMTACGGNKAETSAETTATETEAAGPAESTEAKEAEETSEKAEAADGKTYKIGVLQLVQHAALDKANEGFFAALDEAGIKYEKDYQNASGDQSTCQTMAEKLVNEGNDLIFAIATPAAQAVAGATSDIPILLSAVTDPAASELVESNEKPNCNVSGTSDLTPVKDQIDMIPKILPEAKTVGLLYCNAESNSQLQVEIAKEACEAAGLEYKEYTISNSNELQTVVESMVGNVDVIYAPTDNMIAAGMSTVSMVANENKIPTVVGEGGMVDEGGLVTYGIDYYQLGYMAGEQAIDILVNGADITTMPIGYLDASKCELKINEETEKTLGIDLSVLK